MKTTIISAVIAMTAVAASSSALAAGAHDGYYQAFYGTHENTSPTMGDATRGAQSDTLWNADAAYRQTFNSGGPTGMPTEAVGKAALGTPSGPDGNAIYHGIFSSD